MRILIAIMKLIPVLGDALENKQSEDGGKGKFQWGKFLFQALRIGATIGTTILMNR